MAERLSLMILGAILITLGILNISNKSLKAVIKEPIQARKTAKETAENTADDSAGEVENGANSAA